ncbi:sugar phosphate isomerase/epimerase family protein [Roseiflexus castenholzii]|uniref:Xylose isomerase domain protein TIM barrel n=1 Tax=Roseiflexus castenholzii (strain DSM 13941 / HLO8) TaxID=383372 RepID=A7NLI8_ROSCS|nr:sugar phosphate isomerase/epimerase family protein [Roseiflexus castenholzii]ABU58379.1 Xylose isomerase domain protein TIM barrel [Roseiflexus castenholzii DSM 13941]
MRFAYFTAGMPELTPDEAVSALRDAGYDGIEWRVTDQTPSADGRPGFWTGNRCTWPMATFVVDAPRIRALTEGAGLAMPNVGTYVTCNDLPAVEQALQGAAALGAPCARINVPRYDGVSPYLSLRDRSRAQYREVAAMARQYGVRALIEIHMGNITPSASAAAAFLDGFDPGEVGAIHDAGNMVYEGYEQYRLGLEALGPYLAHVHIKNARWERTGARDDGSVEWRATFAPLRKGVADIAALIRALKAVGYDGWLSFEDFSTERPLAERIVDNLAYVKNLLGRL